MQGLLIRGPMLVAAAGAAADPATYSLPGYALGQPLAESRRVVPAGESPAGWLLRCSGDPDAPAALAALGAHRPADAPICWPMRLTADGPVRAATLPRRLNGIEQLEFGKGRLRRIIQAWQRADGTVTSVTYQAAEPSGR